MSLQLCFSTLGCHKWEWMKLLDHAKKWGYEGIEIRFINGTKDFFKLPEFSSENIGARLKEVEERGLKVSCIGASMCLVKGDEENFLDGKRCVDVAAALKAPYVRIFGGKSSLCPDVKPEELMDRAAANFVKLGEYGRSSGVMPIIETHDDFISCRKVALLLEKTFRVAKNANVGVLWDAHHPFRVERESLETTWDTLGAHVRHVHVKDSKKNGEKFDYCLCGQGDIPVKETLELLKAKNWSGWVSVEWEAAWHPSIEPGEVALPQYQQALKQWIDSPKPSSALTAV
jgi:sugar phosphate isomerase/epimerase